MNNELSRDNQRGKNYRKRRSGSRLDWILEIAKFWKIWKVFKQQIFYLQSIQDCLFYLESILNNYNQGQFIIWDSDFSAKPDIRKRSSFFNHGRFSSRRTNLIFSVEFGCIGSNAYGVSWIRGRQDDINCIRDISLTTIYYNVILYCPYLYHTGTVLLQ